MYVHTYWTVCVFFFLRAIKIGNSLTWIKAHKNNNSSWAMILIKIYWNFKTNRAPKRITRTIIMVWWEMQTSCLGNTRWQWVTFASHTHSINKKKMYIEFCLVFVLTPSPQSTVVRCRNVSMICMCAAYTPCACIRQMLNAYTRSKWPLIWT